MTFVLQGLNYLCGLNLFTYLLDIWEAFTVGGKKYFEKFTIHRLQIGYIYMWWAVIGYIFAVGGD